MSTGERAKSAPLQIHLPESLAGAFTTISRGDRDYIAQFVCPTAYSKRIQYSAQQRRILVIFHSFILLLEFPIGPASLILRQPNQIIDAIRLTPSTRVVIPDRLQNSVASG